MGIQARYVFPPGLLSWEKLNLELLVCHLMEEPA